MNQEQVFDKIVWDYKNPTRSQLSELFRQLIFWQAIATYLNAGGDIGELHPKFVEICYSDEQELMPIEPPEGFVHLRSDVGEDRRTVTHVFANEKNGEAIYWIEDVVMEKTTLDDIACGFGCDAATLQDPSL